MNTPMGAGRPGSNFRRIPWFLTLLTAAAIAAFISLGHWQWSTGNLREAQAEEFARGGSNVEPLGTRSLGEMSRFQRVRITGKLDPEHQFLLDNRTHGGRPGYEVLTPLERAGGELILVNRGWIPAPAEHSVVPSVTTPAEPQEVTGSLWLPSSKIFALETPPASGAWQPIWQNMDMERYLKSVPFKSYPLVVRLDPDSPAGGFVRNWPRPAERIETHLGYAYQWFGFAATLIAIYFVLSFKKVNQ